jgi:hypothetical protein
MHPAPTTRLVLRDLPLAARLTLALFLTSTGVGYVAALVQLHFQHASPGNVLPTGEDAVKVFHGQTGDRPMSKIERLVRAAPDSGRFNGSGQMSDAFFKKSDGWKDAIKERAKALAAAPGKKADAALAEAAVRQEREGERQALIAWLEAGASPTDFKNDRFTLPDSLAAQSVTEKYLVAGDDGKPAAPRAVKVASVLQDRCVRCHQEKEPEDAAAAKYPFDTPERLKAYTTVQTASAMSLTKLAQTTHVHLLGFSMLYGLTGLVLAFSSYPMLLRCVLCPLPLLAQLVDISFWWLARLEAPYGPYFAHAIAVTGGVVAVGLLAHIALGLFDLFGKKGKFTVVLLFVAAAAGAGFVHDRIIQPYLAAERAVQGENGK